jgi:hypothetical protein
MDYQVLFNIAFAIIGVLGGWFLRIIWDSIKGLTADLKELEAKSSETYARRDDMRLLHEALFKKLDRIEDKLDRKVDKL